MYEARVDCATGHTTMVEMSVAQASAYDAEGQAAAAQAQTRSAALAFRQQQMGALAGISAALHGPQGPADAAALASLVHKLTADPALPLSAPEVATLVRFVLRCLLP